MIRRPGSNDRHILCPRLGGSIVVDPYLVMGDLELRLKYKKEESDDWTKVEDRALRKKIQNRLAKRKNRRFLAQNRELNGACADRLCRG